VACPVLQYYSHLWPVRFYNIFPHYLINDTTFEKKKIFLNIKCVFRLSLQLLPAKFLILRRFQTDFIINVHSPARNVLLSFLSDFNIYQSVRFFNSCRRLPETKSHSSMFLHLSGFKFLVVMVAYTPSIHVLNGRPLFLLSHGIQSIINFGILSSGILLTWPYHCSLFYCIISMMSGFPFTPIISFKCSFFILSILDFLAHPLSTSISVNKILFISQ